MDYQKMDYQKLVYFLTKEFEKVTTVKKGYIVLSIPDNQYHITIFRDQWDDYEKIMKKPYHLFHISSNNEENRCSSYFWADIYALKIQKIPRGQFLYNQPSYSLQSSTRSPCLLSEIMGLVRVFQRMLNLSKKLKI